MRNYVIINGVNSNTINGLAINELPPITKPPMRVLQEEIDGRDGDITTNLGYGAYDKVMTIGLFHTFDINQIIAFFNGSGTIVFSNEPDKKYNYKIIDQIDYEKLISFKTATVTLHCQPFKYPLEETPLIIEPTIVTLENVTSASIETNDSTLSTTLKGNTSQNSTTQGKNLFNKNTITSGYRLDSSGVPNGEASNEFTSDFIEVESGETYIRNNGSVSAYTRTCFYDISKTFVSKDDENQSFTIPNNVKFIRFSEYLSRLDTMQLEKGNTVTPYEPFTPNSPSPNYPSPINVVSGDNTIEICGKNLFDKDNANINKSYVANDGTYYTDNNARASVIKIQPNTTYTLTMTKDGFNPNNYWMTNIALYSQVPTNNSVGNSYYSYRNNNSVTLTTGANDLYMAFSICYGATYTPNLNNYLSVIQLEKGNQATTYEAYQSQTYPINLPVENLFDMSSITENTYLDEHGDTGSSSVTNLSDYIDIGNNSKCTLSYDYSSLLNNVSRALCFYNSSKTFLSGVSYTPTDKTTTFNIPSNTKYVRFAYDKNCYEIQLEKGKKANHYTPYGTTPIELCKTENNQEYIYKDSDKWYWHKETRKLVLDGNENWLLNSSSGDSYRYWIRNDDFTNTFTNCLIGNEGVLLNKLFNDHFTQSLFSNTAIGKFSINNDSGSRWFLLNVGITTVENFKTWLSNNNVEVRYVLATPTNIEITNTELIGQLESLMSATTYDGITNINQQNNDLPFIMDLSYMAKDTDKVIVDNIGNIYSKPTIALEGNGTGGIYLNDNQILSVELTDKMTISISDMEAFDPDTHALLNRDVTGNYNSMTLQPNENTIKITGGITKATITDYTRWL